MSFLFKDKSWVNKVIFPAPKPPLYTVHSFPGNDPYRGRLVWIPRRRPQVLREEPPDSTEHDPNSVPCLLVECPYPGSERVLLYCHGNSEDIGNCFGVLAKLRDTLHVHCMAVEYPGYGVSAGQASESGLNNDLLVVYSFLTGAMGVKPENVILFGYSIGTGPTTHLAANKTVGGLVLVAPYTSIRDMVQCVLPKGVGKVAQFLISNRFNNAEEIRSVTCPTLIVHGEADQLIPFAMSERLHERCASARKQLYLAKSLDHCYDDDDFEAYVLFPVMDFFNFSKTVGQLRLPKYVTARAPEPTEAQRAKAAQDAEQAAAEEPDLKQDGAPPLRPPAADGAGLVKPERPSTPPRPFNATQPWACPVCTYSNENGRTCEMCMAPRPAAEVAASAVMAVVEWACPTCTFVNQRQLMACELCESPNPAAAAGALLLPTAATPRHLQLQQPPRQPSAQQQQQHQQQQQQQQEAQELQQAPQQPAGQSADLLPLPLFARGAQRPDDEPDALAGGALGALSLAERSLSEDELQALAAPWRCGHCHRDNPSQEPRCSCGTPRLQI